MTVLPSPIPHPLDYCPWDLPGWAYEALEWVVGFQWPEGDEAATWDVADRWYALVQALTEPRLDAFDAAHQVIEGYGGAGVTAQGFIDAWSRLAADQNAPLNSLLDISHEIGAMVERAGCDIEGAKLEAWIELGIFVIELIGMAVAVAMTLGAASPAAGGLIAATRIAIQQIFKRLVEQLGRKAIRKTLTSAGERAARQLTTKEGLRELGREAAHQAVDEAREELATNASIQLYQKSSGRAHGVSWGDLGMSAAGGAAGGLAAEGAHIGKGHHHGGLMRGAGGEILGEFGGAAVSGDLPGLESVAKSASSGVAGAGLHEGRTGVTEGLAGLTGLSPLPGDPLSGGTSAAISPSTDSSPSTASSISVGALDGLVDPPREVPTGHPLLSSALSQASSRLDPTSSDALSSVVASSDVSSPVAAPSEVLSPVAPSADAPSPIGPSTDAPPHIAPPAGAPPQVAPSADLSSSADLLSARRHGPGAGESDPSLSGWTYSGSSPAGPVVTSPLTSTPLPSPDFDDDEPSPPGHRDTAPPAAYTPPPTPATHSPGPSGATAVHSGASTGTPPTGTDAPAAPRADDRAAPRADQRATPRAHDRAVAPPPPAPGLEPYRHTAPAPAAHVPDIAAIAAAAVAARASGWVPPPTPPDPHAGRQGYFDYAAQQRAAYAVAVRRAEVAALRDEAVRFEKQARHLRRTAWLARYLRFDPHAANLHDGNADILIDRVRQIDERIAGLENGTIPYAAATVDEQSWHRLNADAGMLTYGPVGTGSTSALTGDDHPPSIDRTRRYDRPGGLRAPLAQHQLDLEVAVPRDGGGDPVRLADPRSAYFSLVNDGGPAADPTRGINCQDCVLSFYETYMHARPRVSAPRTFDSYLNGEPQNVQDGEAIGPERVEHTTGGRFQSVCGDVSRGAPAAAKQAVDHGFADVSAQLIAGGHGSFAFIITAWEGGSSHAWAAINQGGEILFLDPQSSKISPRPLYGHSGQASPANPVAMDALVVNGHGNPMPFPDRADGTWHPRETTLPPRPPRPRPIYFSSTYQAPVEQADQSAEPHRYSSPIEPLDDQGRAEPDFSATALDPDRTPETGADSGPSTDKATDQSPDRPPRPEPLPAHDQPEPDQGSTEPQLNLPTDTRTDPDPLPAHTSLPGPPLDLADADLTHSGRDGASTAMESEPQPDQPPQPGPDPDTPRPAPSPPRRPSPIPSPRRPIEDLGGPVDHSAESAKPPPAPVDRIAEALGPRPRPSPIPSPLTAEDLLAAARHDPSPRVRDPRVPEDDDAAARRAYFGYLADARTRHESQRREDHAAFFAANADQHRIRAARLNEHAEAVRREGATLAADRYRADARELSEIATEFDELIDRVRAGDLAPAHEVVAGSGWARINDDIGDLAAGGVGTDDRSGLTGDDVPPPIDRTRRYDERGGLRRPLAVHQQDLENAMPRDGDGRVRRLADPRAGGWFGLANDGGPTADPTRGINCADGVLSLFETYMHGRPRVSAPRTFDAYAHGDTTRPLGAEDGGLARIEAAVGGTFQGLCPDVGDSTPEQARHALNTAVTTLRNHLLETGHGTYAFIVTAARDGGSHTWAAINQNGTILFLDPQTGRLAEGTPLYTDNVTAMDALVVNSHAKVTPLPSHGPGQWSQQAPAPTGTDDAMDGESAAHRAEQEAFDSLPAQTQAALSAAYEQTKAIADRILGDIAVVVDSVPGSDEDSPALVDVEHRAKTPMSIARAYRDESLFTAIPLDRYVDQTKDRVRFSVQLPERTYARDTHSMLDGLAARGYRVIEIKSFWGSPGRHNGLNATLVDPQDETFELQFPTALSREVGKRTHALYEVVRNSYFSAEARVDAFLQILATVKESNISEHQPADLNSLEGVRNVDSSFARWIAANPAEWAAYARSIVSLQEVLAGYGLTPSDVFGERSEEAHDGGGPGVRLSDRSGVGDVGPGHQHHRRPGAAGDGSPSGDLERSAEGVDLRAGSGSEVHVRRPVHGPDSDDGPVGGGADRSRGASHGTAERGNPRGDVRRGPTDGLDLRPAGDLAGIDFDPRAVEQRLLSSLTAGERTVIDESVDQAVRVADRVLGDLVRAVGSLRGFDQSNWPEIVDTEDRFKRPGSLARAYVIEHRAVGTTLTEFLAELKDRVRFSVQVTEADYARSVLAVLTALRLHGYDVGKKVSFWAASGRHNGLNVTLTDPHGFTVELQFPTALSRQVGSRTHPLYEIARLSDAPAEYRVEAFIRMLAINRDAVIALHQPRDLEALQPMKRVDTTLGHWLAAQPVIAAQYAQYLRRRGETLDDVVERHGLTRGEVLGTHRSDHTDDGPGVRLQDRTQVGHVEPGDEPDRLPGAAGQAAGGGDVERPGTDVDLRTGDSRGHSVRRSVSGPDPERGSGGGGADRGRHATHGTAERNGPAGPDRRGPADGLGVRPAPGVAAQQAMEQLLETLERDPHAIEAVVDGRAAGMTIDAAVQALRGVVGSLGSRRAELPPDLRMTVRTGDGSSVTWQASTGMISISV